MPNRYCSYVRGWADDSGAEALSASSGPAQLTVAAPSAERVELLISRGRFGAARDSLQTLDDLLPILELSGESATVLSALYGRVVLRIAAESPTPDLVSACDLLDRSATERRDAVWAAVASALRARIRLDAGQVASAMADLARVDLDQFDHGLDSAAGFALLDVTASSAARLRLYDRADDARRRLDGMVSTRSATDQALHWTGWAVELVGQAMEPVARGSLDPNQAQLEQALTLAGRVGSLDQALVPPPLRRTADGVRALVEAHRGRPAEALRILGRDAFQVPDDLAPADAQVVRLAALHAHTVAGSNARARSLDDLVGTSSKALPSVVLEVCRARDRLRLEGQAGGDVIPVLERLTVLLSELAWQGMDLASQAARQALDHQSLHTESRTDPLTGVGNRRALDEELRAMLRGSPLPMALVLVDVDEFKAVNDRFSHVVGDEVLRRVAASLARGLRSGDRLVRYGGDEFVVLLPRTGDQDARQVAARMTEAIARLPWAELADGLQVQVTTGCAALWSLTSRRPDPDAERLFMRADQALLEAKRRRGTPEPVRGWEPPPRPFPVVDLRAGAVNGSAGVLAERTVHADARAERARADRSRVAQTTVAAPTLDLRDDVVAHLESARIDRLVPVESQVWVVDPPAVNGSHPHPALPAQEPPTPLFETPLFESLRFSGPRLEAPATAPAAATPPPAATLPPAATPPPAATRPSGRRAAIIDLSMDRGATPFG